jgi:hypothetical protein
MNKLEIDMLIGIVSQIISYAITAKPELANNIIIQDLQKVSHRWIKSTGDITMPLVKGKAASSKKGFSENVRREMHEGKPQKQAVAIAYSEAGEGKKKHKSKGKKK